MAYTEFVLRQCNQTIKQLFTGFFDKLVIMIEQALKHFCMSLEENYFFSKKEDLIFLEESCFCF